MNALRLYQQGAYREAAVQFERVVSGQTRDNPQNAQRGLFFLGKSLFHLDLFQASLSAFEEIVEQGPSNPYFEATLPWLAHLAREMPEPAGIIGLIGQYGDSLEVLRRFRQAESEELYSDLLYLMGRHWYGQGEFDAARRFFLEVPRGSAHYYQARFFAGITHVREQRARPAVRLFRQVADDLDRRIFLNRQERQYRDLAWLSLARVFYSTRHWESAVEAWNRVPSSSEYWPEAMFERSWAQFQTDEHDRALGNVHTLTSPYFDEVAFPEALILQAVMYFGQCQYERSVQALDRFEQLYVPLRAELEASVQPGDAEAVRQASFELLRRQLAGQPGLSERAARLLGTAFGDRTLRRHLALVELLDAEEARLERMPAAFRQSGVGARVLQDLVVARTQAVDSAGELARARRERLLGELGELENQATAIRIEILSTQRQSLEHGAELVPERVSPEVVADAEHVIWPFEGEYWRDELGTYRERVVDRCGR